MNRKIKKRIIGWSLILTFGSILLTFVSGFHHLSFYFCAPIGMLLGISCGSVGISAMIWARKEKRKTWDGFIMGFRTSLLFILIPFIVASVSSLLTETCDYLSGVLFYVMGPVLSALFGLSFGVAIGVLVKKSFLAYGIFYLIFIGSFAFNLYEIYYNPPIFFFNPFLGLYPGALYDDLIYISTSYIWFRVFCISIALFVVSLSFYLVGEDFRYRLNRIRFSEKAVVLPIVSGFSTIILWALSHDLNFRIDQKDVEGRLSQVVSSQHCIIRYDPSIKAEIAALLLEDCNFRCRQAEEFFGVSAEKPIEVFLYKDDEQKNALLGARKVEFTKPWLFQVHIAEVLPGDPVLGHEIAHIYAGILSENLLHLPLKSGFLPNWPIIEGLANACAFASDGHSLHEWSLAIARVGMLEDLDNLFQTFGFFQSNTGKAYTVAGSFLRFIWEVYGKDVIREIAKGKDIEKVMKKGLSELLVEWQTYLGRVGDVTTDLLVMASERFSGKGVLGRRCPIDTSKALFEAGQAIQQYDFEKAKRILEKGLKYSPDDKSIARLLAWLSFTENRCGMIQDAEQWLDMLAIVDCKVLSEEIEKTDVIIGLLQDVKQIIGSAPESRGIDIRLHLLTLPPKFIKPLFAVITGLEPRKIETLITALSVFPDDGVLHYLLAKAYLGEGNYPYTLHHTKEAILLGLPTSSLLLEAEKVGAISAFWAKDYKMAEIFLNNMLKGDIFMGTRMVIEEYLRRLKSG